MTGVEPGNKNSLIFFCFPSNKLGYQAINIAQIPTSCNSLLGITFIERNQSTKLMRRTQESTMEDEKRSISKSRRIWEETEKMWGIVGPAILLSVSQYSLEFVTSAFVGHLGAFELAAVSIIHNLVQGFVYGLMD